jgi:hypothetical protein
VIAAVEVTRANAGKDIDPETYPKLSKALTLMLGIDPIVVMKEL